MARMIPPYLSEDVQSPGEKALFFKLRDDPATKDWIVLHSLFVAEHPKRISGEIDFVVIVPNYGVLCLEVKAGNVSRKNGMWVYGEGSNAKTSGVGPFRQASDSMHKIRTYLCDKDTELKNIMFFSGVLFTARIFDEESPEWHEWQYADRNSFSRKPISLICTNILKSAHAYVSKCGTSAWYDNKLSRPTVEQATRMMELLRGDFEYFISPEEKVHDLECSIKRYTEEQFKALDLLGLNDRVLYKGPAGTGKTFLAMEAARRSVLSGNRTLLLCYNNLLGKWLIENTGSLKNDNNNQFIVGTLHKFLLSISGQRAAGSNSQEFWNNELPSIVIDRCLNGVIKAPMFKYLIIDEVQDITSDLCLDVLDLLLEGGLSGGKWAMFGDFERQAIYKNNSNSSGEDIENRIKERSQYYTQYPLRINCRNDESIAIGVELSCHLSPGYTDYLHHGGDKGVEAIFYNTSKEQLTGLRNIVRQLKSTEKYPADSIVVLSSKRDEECSARMLEEVDETGEYIPIRSSGGPDGQIGYSTIHSFKGLESPVVIITDINRITGEQYEALLYVGMSRARVRLVLLMHESCRENWKVVLQNTFISKNIKE